MRLLDVPDLLRELRGLERCRGTSGRDRVTHAPGGHDDCANACAGALVLALQARDDVARRETTTWALALSADAHRQSETLPVNSAGHKPW